MTKYNQRFWILARNVPGRLIWWRHLMPECQGQATFLGLCLYGCHPHLFCSQIFGLSQIFILLFEFVLPCSCNPQSRLNCEDHYHWWVLLPTTYKISSTIWTISWKILFNRRDNQSANQPCASETAMTGSFPEVTFVECCDRCHRCCRRVLMITNKLYLVQTYLIRIVHCASIFGLTVDKSCRQEI